MSDTPPTSFVCLRPEDPELQRAWQTFPDPIMAYAGEVLEYMGTAHAGDGQWHHEFRHHCWPQIGYRRYWHVPAEAGWQP